MNNTSVNSTKRTRLAEAESAFAQVVADASQRGFYGTTGLVLSVQDGHIQHVKISIEKMIK